MALAQIRLRLGMSPEELARRARAGVTGRMIERAEAGQPITYQTAKALLQTLNAQLRETHQTTVTFQDLQVTVY